MPRRGYRSSSYKEKKKKTEKGTRVQRSRKEGGKPRCVCGRELSGVSKENNNGPRSSRRSNRPYGGMLCPICAQRRIREEAREQLKG